MKKLATQNQNSHDNIVRFSVSLEKALLDFLDQHIITTGYDSRSEFIRDTIRERMVQHKWDGEEEGIGVLTILYDHHHKELSDRMLHLQHSHILNIVCSTHVHLSHHDCLEIIIIKGKPSDIEKMSLEIAGLKGVKHSALSKTAAL